MTAVPAPFDEYRDTVREEWIDYNGHMNVGYYVVAFDLATDAWLDFLGVDEDYRDRRRVTTFTLEAHVTYQRELMAGMPLRFTTRLLGFDRKRIHYFHELYHGAEGYLAATNELLSVHVSLDTRRSAPMSEALLKHLADIKKAHDRLARPAQVGRVIGLR